MLSVPKGKRQAEPSEKEELMKKNRLQIMAALALLLSVSLLASCGSPAAREEAEERKLAAAVETGALPAIEETMPEKPAEDYAALTLEALLGEDYGEYLTETITMQMGNRMDKTPDIRYFPIVEQRHLSDYVSIGEQTEFEVDGKGNPVIFFPAGAVTDAGHGEQSFIIPKLYP